MESFSENLESKCNELAANLTKFNEKKITQPEHERERIQWN